MKRDKPLRKIPREHCAEIGDDDGRNPRDDKHRHARQDAGRKARQLCRQVAEAIDWVLTSDVPDDFLRSLRVATVEPAPNSSRLLVTVVTDLSTDEAEPQLILERLKAYAGRLRAEVAGAINRRKTPTLAFQVVGNIPPR
jgi:ribosome-binding factor A